MAGDEGMDARGDDTVAGDEACGGVEFSSSLDAPGELDLYRKLFSL